MVTPFSVSVELFTLNNRTNFLLSGRKAPSVVPRPQEGHSKRKRKEKEGERQRGGDEASFATVYAVYIRVRVCGARQGREKESAI